MYMMGVSMAISLKGRKGKGGGVGRVNMLIDIARRTATLFAIGLFLDCPDSIASWRIPGVLQYFAFSYAWVSLAVVLCGSWDGEAATAAAAALDSQEGHFRDLSHFWREWPVVALAPALWLVLSFGVHVPGCGYGYLGPGGRSGGDGYEECTGGSHRQIDLQVFGHDHIFDGPTCKEPYQCKVPYDPEGLVGAFNAVLLTYLGLLAGRALIYHKGAFSRVKRLGIMGAVCLFLGAALCGWKKEGGYIPVNKNLWSTSFVLVCGGGGFWVLSILYLVVDEWKLWDGAPFR